MRRGGCSEEGGAAQSATRMGERCKEGPGGQGMARRGCEGVAKTFYTKIRHST